MSDACVKCIKCRCCVGACDCTGGPQTEQECTCYELIGGHRPGCYFNRPRQLDETVRFDEAEYDRVKAIVDAVIPPATPPAMTQPPQKSPPGER